jgi:hypothetical protein
MIYKDGNRSDHRKRGTPDCSTKSPERIDRFLAAYEALCREHGLVLSHEDQHGGFVIEKFEQGYVDWAKDAAIGATFED